MHVGMHTYVYVHTYICTYRGAIELRVSITDMLESC